MAQMLLMLVGRDPLGLAAPDFNHWPLSRLQPVPQDYEVELRVFSFSARMQEPVTSTSTSAPGAAWEKWSRIWGRNRAESSAAIPSRIVPWTGAACIERMMSSLSARSSRARSSNWSPAVQLDDTAFAAHDNRLAKQT